MPYKLITHNKYKRGGVVWQSSNWIKLEYVYRYLQSLLHSIQTPARRKISLFKMEWHTLGVRYDTCDLVTKTLSPSMTVCLPKSIAHCHSVCVQSHLTIVKKQTTTKKTHTHKYTIYDMAIYLSRSFPIASYILLWHAYAGVCVYLRVGK